MNILEQGFETLGQPQSNAQAVLEAITQHGVVVKPRLVDGVVKLAPHAGGSVLKTVPNKETLQIQARGETYSLYDEAISAETYKYLAIGELALQAPEDYLLGLSFTLGRKPEEAITISEGTAQLFLSGRPMLYEYASKALRPGQGRIIDLTREKKVDRLLSCAYTSVPTINNIHTLRHQLRSYWSTTDVETTFADWDETFPQDPGLVEAAILAPDLPELSARTILTRYLLHQLIPTAALNGNELALTAAEDALNNGVEPISFTELHTNVQNSVAALVHTKKYL